MERIIRCTIPPEAAGFSLLDFLLKRFTYHDADAWQKVLDNGELQLNQQLARGNEILRVQDLLEYHPRSLQEPTADCRYRILYEDKWILGVAKSPNLVIHPAGPYFRNTLWYLLRERFGNEIYPVNRLDRETSGVVLFARSAACAAKLGKQLPRMQKSYLLWVHGNFGKEKLSVRGFLGNDPESIIRKKRRFYETLPPGTTMQSAETVFVPLQLYPDSTILRVFPKTGRTHQIRATALSLGYPVVGDKLYGRDERLFLKLKDNTLTPEDRALLRWPHQALHAESLGLIHPDSGKPLQLHCRADFAHWIIPPQWQ